MKILILTLSFVFGLTFVRAQDELPNLSLKNLDGSLVNIQDISKNDQLTIVSLWATWCVPCKNELDAIGEVYSDWQDETNVKLYAVSIDDSRTVKRVKPLVNGKGWEFDVLLDTNSDLKRLLNAPTVPVTLIVKNNQILYRHSGYTPGAEEELFAKVKEFAN
ncbi:TlpA disulfide reductase family protein [Mangrovimonas sp. ST2L15]|uniref:TlpA family protein disulfide reductase n=1 Tax=Mangrovimonas sp. ST2L15 TaxID=1645916 RepID=UPI0006B61DA7|nr:TlpA disulfide reductase family protein [Mangrovimonas sp. ST2L15]